jgi:(2Fe-2S) ferredoxin
VCVHGRRDRCCARKGMPVFSAIERAAPDDTFQTTHLGGHRFAATLVVLPAGICYGRVNPEEGEALVRAHRAGRLHDLERMRGRMRFAQSVQSAEIALRRALGVMGVSDLRYLGAVSEDGHTRCEFRELASGATHTIRVHEQALAPIAPSCGADPKPGEAWVELRLH